MAKDLIDGKNPLDPSETSRAWDFMAPSWVMIDTLLGGTKAMRDAGEIYLPQHAEESSANYSERLETNVLFNAMELTLDHFVGRPFSDPVKLNNDVPEAIAEHMVNIDLQGNDITTFCREWFRTGLAKGFCHVMVDMPQMNPEAMPQTLADDRASGRRPFWIKIDPENMIAAESDIQVDPVTGELREMFTHVRLRETIVQRVGFRTYDSVCHTVLALVRSRHQLPILNIDIMRKPSKSQSGVRKAIAQNIFPRLTQIIFGCLTFLYIAMLLLLAPFLRLSFQLPPILGFRSMCVLSHFYLPLLQHVMAQCHPSLFSGLILLHSLRLLRQLPHHHQDRPHRNRSRVRNLYR